MVPVCKRRVANADLSQDILQTLDEIKTTITFQYGFILQMDSTRNVARKPERSHIGVTSQVTIVVN